MQRNSDGTRYCESESNCSPGFSVSLMEVAVGRIHVDMWKPDHPFDGCQNHWHMDFSDFDKALAEYNKWAKVRETPKFEEIKP